MGRASSRDNGPGWACLDSSCSGRIRGYRESPRGRELLYEGDRETCPKCGAEYLVEVTDDYSDDCVASLVPAPADGKDGGR